MPISLTAWGNGAERGAGLHDPSSETDFRQLRHHTKNALQRILVQIQKDEALQATHQGRRLVEDLEQRVLLSAAISDALFGLTHEPAPMPERLRMLCRSTIDLLADPDQTIRLDVSVEGLCPEALKSTVLRIAHEFVANAVKHGMHMRLMGRIVVRLSTEAGRTVLLVSDDGWGLPPRMEAGQGLSLADDLAREHGGTASLRRGRTTVARLELPHCGTRAGATNPSATRSDCFAS
jgi:two-component sensor histidine kinase